MMHPIEGEENKNLMPSLLGDGFLLTILGTCFRKVKQENNEKTRESEERVGEETDMGKRRDGTRERDTGKRTEEGGLHFPGGRKLEN